MTSNPDKLGLLLHDATRLLRKRFAQRASGYGLTSAQWRVLAILARFGSASQARLADRLEIEPISVSRMIDRMEQAGWVARVPDPTDRRIKMIVPTERSRAAEADMKALAASVYDEALEAFSPEAKDALLSGLTTLITTLSACSGEPPTCDEMKEPK